MTDAEAKLIFDATTIATGIHWEQKRLDGFDYIMHPLRVATFMDTVEEKILAILHDTLEDCKNDWTKNALLNEVENTFDHQTHQRLVLISRKEGEAYVDFIQRIIDSHDAVVIKVKLADIADNAADLGYLVEIGVLPKKKALDRLDRYSNAKQRLEGALS